MPADGHFHAVRFYEDGPALCRIVAAFIGEGLAAGEPVVVVATPEHRAEIQRVLGAAGSNGRPLGPAPDLTFLDAEDLLALLMVDGMPQRTRFEPLLGDVLRTVRGSRIGCRVRIYGEMVDLLWHDGRQQAAIHLEMLWNELASREDFALLCGYGMGTFCKAATLEAVHAQHTHIVVEDGTALAL